MVTNPATRDWTVTASLFATLNEMFGNRTICGIGRGDSAVRVINGKPVTLATLREAIEVIRALANGGPRRLQGQHAALPVGRAARGCRSGSPPTARRRWRWPARSADGFILQLADPDITAWSIAAVRKAAAERPAATRRRSRSAWPRRPTSPTAPTPGWQHGRDQCRWFGGMVGNHVADIVARYGADGGGGPEGADRLHRRPRGLRLQLARQGRQHPHRLRAGRDHRPVLPDRPGRARRSSGSRSCEALGVDQFALYLQHDAKDATLAAYGDQVMPAVNVRAAKTS